MAGQIQMPSSYVRLINKPLDISLTFDTLSDAKKYAAGTDNSKGTPYDGQIISVNKLANDNNLCGTFKLETTSLSINPTIDCYRIVLLEAKNLITGEVITPENFIINKSDSGVEDWLLVYKQTIRTNNNALIAESALKSKSDILLCNKSFAYSLLCLTDIFCNRDGMIEYKLAKINTSTGEASSINTDIVGALVSGKNENISGINTTAFYINQNNILTKSDAENLSYIGSTNQNAFSTTNGTIEIYINITDYLSRDGVK